MYCPKCGANISDENVFCVQCGFKIGNGEEHFSNVNNKEKKETNSNLNSTQEKIKLNENNLPNDKNILKKIIIICTIAVVVIVGGGFGIYQYSKIKTYNNLITNANKSMEEGEYDQAIALFNQSLQFKSDLEIQKSIKVATVLKEIKAVFDEGTKLMNDKKYLAALECFEKITKEDYNLYNNAQNNIMECSIQLANDAVKNNMYDDANKYIDRVLNIDATNVDAKKLKADIAVATKEEVQQNQNTEEKTTVVIIMDQPRPDISIGNFVFWNSDRVYLTENQVYSLSNYELGIARNEIYARHGYIFSTEKYRLYFNAQNWYYPISKNVTLNNIELYNVNLIKAEEDRRGVVN